MNTDAKRRRFGAGKQLAWSIGYLSTLAVTGPVSPVGVVEVTETARKRGRTGEIRRVLGELVTSR